MKQTYWIFFLLIAPSLLSAQRVSPKNNVTDEVIENERAVWEAAKNKDLVRFNALVADDARMVFQSGVLTKADYVKGLPNRTISSFVLKNFTAVRPNRETVIVIYEATRSGIYNGTPFPPATVRESSVWVQRGGKWFAVLNQETPIGH